jgi:hypothetical protein
VKVLTLYFIDEVAKYRDYSQPDEKGEYARIFEEEYNLYLNEMLDLDETPYVKYLKGITAEKTHSGYFSIDKKTKRDVDPDIEKRGENAGLSNDVEAYDLILRRQGAPAVAGRAGALHLLALGAARRLGQPQRIRHLRAQAQRQHHLPPPGSGPWPAPVRQPARRPHGPSSHRPRRERADRGGQRKLQGLRRRCRRTSATRCLPVRRWPTRLTSLARC